MIYKSLHSVIFVSELWMKTQLYLHVFISSLEMSKMLLKV